MQSFKKVGAFIVETIYIQAVSKKIVDNQFQAEYASEVLAYEHSRMCKDWFFFCLLIPL